MKKEGVVAVEVKLPSHKPGLPGLAVFTSPSTRTQEIQIRPGIL
jgi:hypothetical protein